MAVIDSTKAGRNVREWLGAPALRHPDRRAALDEALAAAEPAPGTALLIGIAPTGGKLPQEWRDTILAAIAAGLDVLSGPPHVHRRRPGVRGGGAGQGATIVDYRRQPEREETSIGRRHKPGKKVILTVGTDCAIGKMSVALELPRGSHGRRALRRRSSPPARPG